MQEEWPIGRLDHLNIPADAKWVELPGMAAYINEAALRTFLERQPDELLHRSEDGRSTPGAAPGADSQAD